MNSNYFKNKLQKRNMGKYNEIHNIHIIEIHPVFILVSGEIENWEKVIPEISDKIIDIKKVT